MSSQKNIDQKLTDLRIILKNRDKQSIKMDAHGGFSILFVYPPEQESIYLKRITEEYPEAFFIDISRVFVTFIDSIGVNEFLEIYKEYSSEPQRLFKADMSDNDFFREILKEIEKAGKEGKLPVLIRTGALYGTGIENINIMDSQIVHDLPLPLIIMYPGSISADNRLMFLNFKLASDYRAIVIC
ncbi:hypothetical protein JXL19_07375 [bacterium]|nr:hypothetical protein [bacterium]